MMQIMNMTASDDDDHESIDKVDIKDTESKESESDKIRKDQEEDVETQRRLVKNADERKKSEITEIEELMKERGNEKSKEKGENYERKPDELDDKKECRHYFRGEGNFK